MQDDNQIFPFNRVFCLSLDWLMDRQLDSLTLLRRLLCPSLCYICNNPRRNEHKQTMSKAPRSGVLAREPGKGFSSTKKRFLRLIFVRALWRDQGWWTGNKYPWFSTLVLLWRRHREESLNYVRSSEQCHGPLTSQVPAPIWGTIYCFLFVLRLSASLTARTCAYNSHKAALMVCKFKFCAPFNLNSWGWEPVPRANDKWFLVAMLVLSGHKLLGWYQQVHWQYSAKKGEMWDYSWHFDDSYKVFVAGVRIMFQILYTEWLPLTMHGSPQWCPFTDHKVDTELYWWYILSQEISRYPG